MGEIKDSVMERAKRSYELKELERLGLTPDLVQRDSILTFLGMVLRDNEVAELIPRVEEEHLFLRHFCDSLQLLLLFGFKKGATVFDIGSGGGFPAIPIRIFRPDISFMLIEPNSKKVKFLREVKDKLALDNIEIHVGKAESVDSDKKANYVVSRGVGTLQKFAQIAKPFLPKGGQMYTYKTKQFTAELETITSNKDKAGIKISEIAQYDLGNVAHGLNLVSMVVV